jgi:hypothetical protein
MEKRAEEDVQGKLAEIKELAESGRQGAVGELITAVGKVEPKLHVNVRTRGS